MMKAKYFLFILFIFNSLHAQTNSYLLIGTYTSGKSEGIYVYDFNSDTAGFTLKSTAKTANPSYLAVSPDQRTVYAVAETDLAKKEGTGGAVSAFSFNAASGTLQLINQQFSAGRNPCYVAVDKTGKWVFTGNYSSGSAAVFAVNKDGGIAAAKQVIQHSGQGPNASRQEGPHVHATVVTPDNRFLMVPDLGTDKVMIYQFDSKSGKLHPGAQPFAHSAAGSGPRHIAFHPNSRYAYLVEEMSGTVVVFEYRIGKLTMIQRTSALAADFNGIIGSADIHVSPDGRFLYASNRGESNNIAIFSIGEKGKVTLVGHQSTLGKTPRNFNFDPTGKLLLVANQQSDEVVIFNIDRQSGLLTDTGKRIKVPNPVCIQWVKK